MNWRQLKTVPAILILMILSIPLSYAEQNIFKDEESGFAITAPDRWEKYADGPRNVVFAPRPKDIPYMNVHVSRYQGTPTSELFATMVLTMGMQQERGFKLIANDNLVVNGISCTRLISDVTVPNQFGLPMKLRSHSYFFVKDLPETRENIGVRLLFSDKADRFDEIEPIIEQTLSTVEMR